MIKNRLRTVLMILFAAIFIFCIVRLVMIRVQYEQGNEIYSSAVDHYVSSIPETADVPEPSAKMCIRDREEH